MKTAISLDDELFAAADAQAKELGVSRSEFFADSVRRRLREIEDAKITEAINRVCDNPASADIETRELVRSAAKRTFERSEW